MYAALSAGLDSHARVLLVGSDCPSIDAGYLSAAVNALDTHDVVLGPAVDGGYVLIGARSIARSLFENVDWGTSRVYEQTVARLAAAGLSWTALAALPDVDRPEDLPGWYAMGGGEPSPAGGDREAAD